MRLVLALTAGLLPFCARAQEATPEQASAGAQSSFSRLMAPRGIQLPTYADVQRERLRRDLENAGRFSPRDRGPATGGVSFNQTNDPERRFMTAPRFLGESLDINAVRLGRVAAGAGCAERSEVVMGAPVWRDTQKYGFVKLELGRRDEPRAKGARGWVPTATYAETEVSPKPRVARGDYSVDWLKKAVDGR